MRFAKPLSKKSAVIVRPFKIGVAGTHSTGKSTLVSSVRNELRPKGVTVGLIGDLASRAMELGFPILKGHTYESTLWIMADCMRQEAELALSFQVIIVDRPVPDALGYLLAALEVSGRSIPPHRLEELHAITRAHIGDYDLLVGTVLDNSIPLGAGREADAIFRQSSADHVNRILDKYAPKAIRMNSQNAAEVTKVLVDAALVHTSQIHRNFLD